MNAPAFSTATLSSPSADLRLTIDRLRLRLTLPEGTEDAALRRDRLARVVEQELPRACAGALGRLPDTDAVYRIRTLRIGMLAAGAEWNESALARQLGERLATVVMRIIWENDARDVVRFDSPRQFVTTFLRDLLDGRAWGCWYYREFLPLQGLPDYAVARELLEVRPGWIAPVLHALAATGHAERLLERWRADDIQRLWKALGYAQLPVLSSNLPDARLAGLAAVWRGAALSRRSDPGARMRDRLRLWLASTAGKPEQTPDLATAAMNHALVDLAALMRTEPELAPLLQMRTELYPAILRRIAGGPLTSTLGWLAPLTANESGRATLARLATIVSEPASPSPADTRSGHASLAQTTVNEGAEATLARLAAVADEPESLLPADAWRGHVSSVGGIFLLTLGLAELGIWERWCDELGGGGARRYLFIIALKALGRAQVPLLLNEEALAVFAGLGEPPLADARLATEPPGPPECWPGELPGIAARWYPAHERELVVSEAAGLWVIRDAAAGCWLAAYPADVPRPLPSAELDGRAPSADEQSAIAAEVAHLQLGRLGYPWLTPDRDAALSVVASLALRRTAARLPSFAKSSPTYLARQFLAQPATLRLNASALEVHLSGGPLGAVLKLANLAETIAVPWLALPLRLTVA